MKQFYPKTIFFYKPLLLLFLIAFNGYGQIFSDPITGSNITPSSTYFKSASGTTTNTNISADGIKYVSSTNYSLSTNNAYFAYNWTNNNINLNRYYEISLTPNSCYQINFNTLDISFTINDQNSNNIGPTRVAIRSSNDNYASDLYNYSIGTLNHSWIATVDISSLTNINGNIKFRIYAWGGNSNNANNNFGINNYSFSNGSVNPNVTTPLISVSSASCASAGIATITNYNAGNTYIFSPSGPTIGSGGVISNMNTGTSYTVRASNSGCNSTNSNSFSIAAQLPTPVTPTVSTTSTTCSSTGSATITNYNAGNSYIFNPTGPTVASGGIISNMITGTSYTVRANNGSCSSGSSISFAITDNSSTTWNGSTWSNGIPDLTKNAIINGDYDMVTNSGLPNIVACSMTLNSPAKVIVKTNSVFTIQNALNITAGSSFIIKNSGSLVQINNTINTGNINVERTAFIDFRDYVYWSSPVANFNSANISTFSDNANLYKWIPTTAAVNGFGNWTSGVETMVLGKGYIERGLNNAPLNSPANFTSTFTGVPNNGNITTPISRGTYSGVNYATGVSSTPATDDDDNWNLLGNPYPSAISAADFLNTNSTNLDGYVKIWSHGIAPNTTAPDPFYNNYGYNYDSNDYITWNLSGSSTPGFSGYIGAGQGFITKMKHTSPTTSSTAIFNNSMRNATHKNNEFFKSSSQQNSDAINEGRIWLDLVSSSASTRSLIAYVNGATNGRDQMYDAQADMKSNLRINSLLGPERFIIQGRIVPFDQNDQVSIAFSAPTNGTYNIAIGAVDGLFEDQSQNIYLEDKQLNTIHDLRSAPYQFTTTQGENIDRFVLRYTNQTLSNDAFDYNNSVSVYANENINIKSSSENIRDIKVYDILGKTLLSKNKVGKNEIVLTELKPTSGLVIVKVVLDNGSEVTKKVIF